jgi:hypothetical protein
MEPDASMYWYEAPASPGYWNRPRHRIVTQYSMNNLDVEDDYWVWSDGTRLPVKEDWTGILPDPEWVWFGDRKCNRVLFLAKHENDDKPDQFWQMQGNMTVFGFGRKLHEDPGTYMDEVPVHLTVGFPETTDNEKIVEIIKGAVNTPLVKVGDIQMIVK